MQLLFYEISQSTLDTLADATMAVLAWLGLNTEYWPPVLGVVLFVWILSALWSLYRNMTGANSYDTGSFWDFSGSSSDCGDSGGDDGGSDGGGGGCDGGGGFD